MDPIRVIYQEHAGHGWSAESPDLPGWRVFGDSYKDTHELAEEGVRLALDCDAEDRGAPAPSTYRRSSTTCPRPPDP